MHCGGLCKLDADAQRRIRRIVSCRVICGSLFPFPTHLSHSPARSSAQRECIKPRLPVKNGEKMTNLARQSICRDLSFCLDGVYWTIPGTRTLRSNPWPGAFSGRFSTRLLHILPVIFAHPGRLGAQLENHQKTANNWTKNGFEIGSPKFAAIIALRKAMHATRNNANNAVCIPAAHATPYSPPRWCAAGGARGPPAPHPHRASTRW